ncbi:hypothetical protein SB6420_04671 [Klebsiella pasteurii]|nr:hypothetical protein SB6420_04671 [Klebsiella pasteurii]
MSDLKIFMSFFSQPERIKSFERKENDFRERNSNQLL